MLRYLLMTMSLVMVFSSKAQFSGYYQSKPEIQGFDHFKIYHHHEHKGEYDGVFTLKAFSHHGLLWEQDALTITGAQAEGLIEKYGQGKEILSVHLMKLLWDGDEWEFFMLGYLDQKKHGRFIIIEERFKDETEEELISIETFKWVRSHKHKS